MNLLPLSMLPLVASAPGEMFRCETFTCGMLGRRCVERQMKRESEGDSEELAACNPAKCEQGRTHREAWPDLVPDIRKPSGHKVEPRPHYLCPQCKNTFEGEPWRERIYCSNTCAGAARHAAALVRRTERNAARAARRASRVAMPRQVPRTFEKTCEVCSDPYTATKPDSRACSKLDCRRVISSRVRTEATLREMRALAKRCEYVECNAEIPETRNPDGNLNLWLHKRRRFCDRGCSTRAEASKRKAQEAA